jgi:hypothetical protein
MHNHNYLNILIFYLFIGADMTFGRATTEMDIIKKISDIDDKPLESKKSHRKKLRKKRLKLIEKLKSNVIEQKKNIEEEIGKINKILSSSYVVKDKHYHEYERNMYKMAYDDRINILDEIEKKVFKPMIVGPLKTNLMLKEAILNNKEISFIDKIRMLNYIADELIRENLPETTNSAIFFCLDIISILHPKIIEDINNRDLYIEMSIALEHLSCRYSFISHPDLFKESFKKLYIILNDINENSFYRQQLDVFINSEKFESLKKLGCFLKDFAPRPNKCVAVGMKVGMIGVPAATIAFYSLPLAGMFLFGAGVAKAAVKLNESCKPRKLRF